MQPCCRDSLSLTIPVSKPPLLPNMKTALFIKALTLLPVVFISAAETPLDLLALPASDGDAVVSQNQWLASSFISGEEAPAYRVEALTIRLDCVAANASVFMGITASVNGRPDLSDIRVMFDETPLTVDTHSSGAFSMTLEPDYTFSDPILMSGGDYWLVFGVTSPDWESPQPAGLYHWSYTTDGGPYAASGGWSVGSAIATGNTGGQNWMPENNTPYLFKLEVSAIPEPSAAVLLLMAGVLFGRRRIA